MFSIREYDDLAFFKNEVTDFLEKYEVENGLLLGLLMNLPMDVQPIFMATIEKEGRIVAVILQTIEEQIIMSKTEGLHVQDMPKLAESLYEVYPNVPGIIGEYDFVVALAKRLSELQQTKVKVVMEQGIYKLTKVDSTIQGFGKIRKATYDDEETIKTYLIGFGEDTVLPVSKEKAEISAKKFLDNNQLSFLEVNGEIVSMCIWSRPTKTNVTISFVYTPNQYRKKGYAKEVVTYVTNEMLASGFQTTSLYTDLANPTSNKIYREIGYEMIMKSIQVYLQ